jgi:DNA-directed RNA polymerase subunit RPC12/RpoP
MIIAEYKCGYCGSTFKLSYFNSVDIPERNVGCPSCRMAGADVKLIKKIRDERGIMKPKKTSSLLYPITVLESERDDIHNPLKSQVAQLQEAIDILTDEKYRRVREEFKKEVEKKETGVVDKHLFKK